MDEWLDDWLDFQSKRLCDAEAEKIRLKRAAHNLLSTQFWKGKN
ncbi:MAG: hypothetical protein QF566_00930 [Candidatus Thalassarchaeaceae archaeon]|jgi:hypothetical protein|nr:hypothetical protein [Candidatus Thalassarchaeaceae archaeon]|tara:strand:+ start:205 stop:336 length:132 start_codon:yes stop_codon:yes gene_type:complete